MGKKILVSCLDVITIAFFQLSIRNKLWSFTVYFSGKKVYSDSFKDWLELKMT